MTLRTGLAAQMGVALETTHGTFVAPSRFFEFNSESMTQGIERLESAGLRAGTRVIRSDRWRSGSKTAGGSIEHDLVDTNLGILLEHCLGSVATVDVGAGAGAFEHTFTPGDLPEGLTVQVGKPDSAGTVHPFSYLGCKVASWTLKGAVGEIGKLEIEYTAQDETTAQALAAATYPANNLLVFVDASLTIAAGAVNVRSVEIAGGNSLDADRRFLGSQIRTEPREADMRPFDGTIEAEFLTLADYNRFINGTEAALVFKFEGSTDIEAGFPPRLQVEMNVRFDGETPEVGGPEEVPLSLPIKGIDDGTGPDSAITVKYQTSDALP